MKVRRLCLPRAHLYRQRLRRLDSAACKQKNEHSQIECFRFKLCKFVHHRTIPVNQQPDATIFHFIILTFIYSSTCFGRFPAHHQELNDCSNSLWFYLRIVVIVVLCSWSGRL